MIDVFMFDNHLTRAFLDLLRNSLELGSFKHSLSSEEWREIYCMAVKQSLVGVCYSGVCGTEGIAKPPRQILLRWALDAERINGLNQKLNGASSVLTGFFAQRGFQSLILKGQANALFYPNPLVRQAGDIDILVKGERDGVIGALSAEGLMEGAIVDGKHIHLKSSKFGASVEVHFKAIDSFSPIACKRIQKFLAAEFSQKKRVELGFFVPSISYALVMQLAHIKQHFFTSGIGLRQLVDYYYLLRNSSDVERENVSFLLESFGLKSMAGAVMWLLGFVLGLDESIMLCKPDKYRGSILLKTVLAGGNFGKHRSSPKQSVWRRWLNERLWMLKLLRFDANEAVWHEIRYWVDTFRLMPYRIKRRQIALRTLNARFEA